MDSRLLAKEFVKRETTLETLKNEKLYSKIPKELFLHLITLKKLIAKTENGTEITLKQLSDKMNLSITEVAQMISKMEDKGLIIWNMRFEQGKRRHTYVCISEHGEELLQEQEAMIETFYANVLGHFSEDQIFKLLGEFSMFDRITEEELYNL